MPQSLQPPSTFKWAFPLLAWMKSLVPAKRRVRLRVGIIGLFLAVTLPLMMVMISWLQYQNATLLGEVMDDVIQRTTLQVVTTVIWLFDPLTQAVILSAESETPTGNALRSAP